MLLELEKLQLGDFCRFLLLQEELQSLEISASSCHCNRNCSCRRFLQVPDTVTETAQPTDFYPNIAVMRDRPAVAHSGGTPGAGHPAHAAGDVQLPPAPHPDPLPRAAAESPLHPGLHPAGQPEPAAPLVGLHGREW